MYFSPIVCFTKKKKNDAVSEETVLTHAKQKAAIEAGFIALPETRFGNNIRGIKEIHERHFTSSCYQSC
jgi:hypothetical protein